MAVTFSFPHLFIPHATIQWDHWLLGPRYGESQEYGQGPPRELKSWIDGLVVATSRIGPAVKAR